MHIESEIVIPIKLVNVAQDAINRELEPSELEKWGDLEKRKNFLDSFLLKIGGMKKTNKSPNFLLDPALHFRNLDVAKKKLLKAIKKIKKSKVRIGLSGAGFPSFVLTLDRFMNHRVWEKDSKIFMQARNERLLMLAAYLVANLNYSEDEMEKFLEDVKKRVDD